MDHETKKTVGGVVGGCGCFLLLVMSAWMCFVIYVGVQGRGNDEEASLIIGGVTCCVAVPVLLLTVAGIFFALKKPPTNGG
jgi:hypothetical protein